MKKQIAFVSRHAPTAEQYALAEKAGMELIHVGDCNAFSMEEVRKITKGYEYIAVAHVASAMLLLAGDNYSNNIDDRTHVICVFENENRAPEGEKPQFFTRRMHTYVLCAYDEGRSAIVHDSIEL